MTLSLNKETYNFLPCEIDVVDWDLENIFRGKKKSLQDTITEGDKYYRDFAELIMSEFKDYLNEPVGEFLYFLKTNPQIEHSILYKDFLQKDYGDGKYCRFSVKHKEFVDTKGIYAFCVDNNIEQPVYIGRTFTSFKKRVNSGSGYGVIYADNCYYGVQDTNCRINHKINEVWDRVSFFIYPMALKENKEIKRVEEELIQKYTPEWNL